MKHQTVTQISEVIRSTTCTERGSDLKWLFKALANANVIVSSLVAQSERKQPMVKWSADIVCVCARVRARVLCKNVLFKM